jgi:mono/diheme cytochrome c family protein
MRKPFEDVETAKLGLRTRPARHLIGIATSFIFLAVTAAIWPSVAKAQGADQVNPALSNQACLGCHGQEGFAPAHKPPPGSPGADGSFPGQRARKKPVR